MLIHIDLPLSVYKYISTCLSLSDPDFWYITYVLLGIIIFFCAPSWSRYFSLHLFGI